MGNLGGFKGELSRSKVIEMGIESSIEKPGETLVITSATTYGSTFLKRLIYLLLIL